MTTNKITFKVIRNISYGEVDRFLETSNLDEKFDYL